MLNVSPWFISDWCSSSTCNKNPVSSKTASPELVPNASVPFNKIVSTIVSRSSSKNAIPSLSGIVPSKTKLSVRLPEPLSRTIPHCPLVVPKGVSARYRRMFLEFNLLNLGVVLIIFSVVSSLSEFPDGA